MILSHYNILMAKEDKHTITLTIRMPVELHESLRTISFRSRVSINQIMVSLIADNLISWRPAFANKEEMENYEKFTKSEEFKHLMNTIALAMINAGFQEAADTIEAREKATHEPSPGD